jgi:hypothetical protein
MLPDKDALVGVASELEHSFADVVDAVRAKRVPRPPLPADLDAVVAAAREAPVALLERLRAEWPALTDEIDEDPPLPTAIEASGTGSASTVAGRVTYGVRLAAGYVSAAGCSTPAGRLFKPDGLAAELFARFRGDAPAVALVVAALDPSLSWTMAGAAADA